MEFKDLPMLFDQGQTVVAIESPLTERAKVLEFLYEVAQSRKLPLYFWNQGYTRLQQVLEVTRLIPTDAKCTSGLVWLLEHNDVPGIFVFEGAISPDAATGRFSQKLTAVLSNLIYNLAANKNQQFLVCVESYAEFPPSLAPLLPVIPYTLPNITEIQQVTKKLIEKRFELNLSNFNEFETLVRTCLGIPLGELEMLLSRSLGLVHTLEELTNAVLAHKKSKLKSQGIEFINEPDVPQASGLDLLEEILERAAALLKPEAKHYNLRFPKGMILWGPPGTGKSLSAKLAASKMGVPMVAADWASLRGTTTYESRVFQSSI